MTKRHLTVIALLLLLAVLAVGCAQDATPTPAPIATPLPAIELNPTSGSIRASGEIVPAHQSRPGFPTAGRIQTITVDEGDMVEVDDLLMSLDDTTAAANVAQAQASLMRAQALLAELKAGPRPQEIAAAEARLDMAEAHLQQLDEGARPDELAAAQAELEAAQAAQRQLYSGPTVAERTVAQAALSSAEAARNQAQAAYDEVAWHSNIGQLPQSLGLAGSDQQLRTPPKRATTPCSLDPLPMSSLPPKREFSRRRPRSTDYKRPQRRGSWPKRKRRCAAPKLNSIS
jgi:multidrug efflux pump subunit AcrA (membrane-fusion protein)